MAMTTFFVNKCAENRQSLIRKVAERGTFV
jgi:hypothetical protein